MDRSRKRSTKQSTDVITAAEPIEQPNITTRQKAHAEAHQNLILVWLDSSIDLENSNESKNIASRLKEIFNKIHPFTDVDAFIQFVNKMEREKVFIVASGSLGQTTIPTIHHLPQVNVIYIFCGNQARHEQWAKLWSKIKGVFIDIAPICKAVKRAAFELDQNLTSISFLPTARQISKQNIDQLDVSFLYTQVIREILLAMHFGPQHINNFIQYCHEDSVRDLIESQVIDKISHEYRHHLPIWWYTYQNLFYSILNRSIQTLNVDALIRMGFFIYDLHNHIVALHKEQFLGQIHLEPFTVVHGQGFSERNFDRLRKSKDGLLSFNNFLLTNTDRQLSLNFIHQIIETSDLVGVLFVMKVDPSNPSIAFANVREVSYFEDEKILFSMHSIFYIDKIERMDDDRLWQIHLTLVDNNNREFHALTDQIHSETYPDFQGWYRLGRLLIKLGDFNKAQAVFDILLDQAMTDREKADIYQQVGFIKESQGQYGDAIANYIKLNQVLQKTLSSLDSRVASSYSSIGVVYEKMGDYSNALSFHQKALEIDQHTLSASHPDLATSYNNIGLVYDRMGDYSNALSFHQKALDIYEKTLPSDHPDLATSYNNVGWVYRNMRNYSRALTLYQRALDIQQRSLPADHPDLQDVIKSIEIVKKKI